MSVVNSNPCSPSISISSSSETLTDQTSKPEPELLGYKVQEAVSKKHIYTVKDFSHYQLSHERQLPFYKVETFPPNASIDSQWLGRVIILDNACWLFNSIESFKPDDKELNFDQINNALKTWVAQEKTINAPICRKADSKPISQMYNLLSMAVASDSLDLVKWLVNKGADMNYKSSDIGMSAFYRSVVLGHIEIARFFMESGANPNKSGAVVREALLQSPIKTLFHILSVAENRRGSDDLVYSEHSAELEKVWDMLKLLAQHGGSMAGICDKKECLPIPAKALMSTINVSFLNRLIEIFPKLGSQFHLPLDGSGFTALELIDQTLSGLGSPSRGNKKMDTRYKNELVRLQGLEVRVQELIGGTATNISVGSNETR
ncbi:MAG: ankyrin repeat domain-containing protein [Endozoicomonas sp.]